MRSHREERKTNGEGIPRYQSKSQSPLPEHVARVQLTLVLAGKLPSFLRLLCSILPL